MSSKIDSVALHKMKKVLGELASRTGRGTELISLYVPPKKALHEVSSSLRNEHGEASNIKSDQTREHVQGALVKTMQRLKLYKQTPNKGLAVFCGALATNGPGSEVLMIQEVMPPKPIGTYFYRCDDHFHLDILKDMLREEKSIGIISIDSTETGLGIVAGSSFEVLDVLNSGVSGKHRAGGQSARRFERLREMEMTNYFHRVADHSYKLFIEENSVKGMIVSGPGYTKNDFIKTELLDYRLQKSILATLDTSYSGSEGVRETLDKSDDVLGDIRVMEERKMVQRFLTEVNSSESKVAYGLREVNSSLMKGSAEIALISEDVDLRYVKLKCKKCENESEVFLSSKEYHERTWIKNPCKRCSEKDHDALEKDIVDYLADLAAMSGTDLEVISAKTEEGSMLKSFGGIAAILRYKI